MIRYLSLAEFFWLAEQVTGIEAVVLTKASRVDLADSALHAPAAGFGEEDFYPDIIEGVCDLLLERRRHVRASRRPPWGCTPLPTSNVAQVWRRS